MFPIGHARTSAMTLDEVVARLSRSDAVDGVLIMGSGGSGTLRPESDYDLLVVLAESPAPLGLAVTTVDGRFSEFLFTDVATVERLLVAAPPLPDDSADAALVGWVQSGRIAFDRAGRLGRLRAHLRAGDWTAGTSEKAVYGAWFKVNYNVRQTLRIVASADPVYLTAADYRLLYGVAELIAAYFTVRRLPWLGEKAFVRYFQAHDPAYLDLFRRCVAEPDRARKAGLYARLAALTLAPLGGLWPDAATAVQFRAAEAEERAGERATRLLALFEGLVGG